MYKVNANVCANETAIADTYVTTVAHVKNMCECNLDIEIHVDVSVNVDVDVNENLNVNLNVHVYGHSNVNAHVHAQVHVHVRQHLMAGLSSLGPLQALAVRSLRCSRKSSCGGRVRCRACDPKLAPFGVQRVSWAPRCLRGPLTCCSIQGLDGLLLFSRAIKRECARELRGTAVKQKKTHEKTQNIIFRLEITHLGTQVCQHLSQCLRFLNMEAHQVLCRSSNM